MLKHFSSFCTSYANYYFPINRHFKIQLVFWSYNMQSVLLMLCIHIIDMSSRETIAIYAANAY